MKAVLQDTKCFSSVECYSILVEFMLTET